MDRIVLKQCAPSNAARASALQTTSFRHPGYDDDDVLFRLPRLDSSPQPGAGASEADAGEVVSAVAGVHHGTALLACQILANNAFDGYLSTDRDGSTLVNVPLDGLLLEDDYWFFVGRESSVYPVVPRFEDWQFPHNYLASLTTWDTRTRTDATERLTANSSIPSSTSISTSMPPTSTSTSTPTPTSIPSSTSTSVPLAPPPPPSLRSTSRCILSNKPYAVQSSHLVPVAQSEWFLMNRMKQYGDLNNRLFIHAEQNKVPLRHDLHKLWDDHVFALVPKLGGHGRAFVVHVLSITKAAITEFASDWHNTPVQQGALDNTGKAFLFAKFAQAIFMLFKPFLAFSSVPRHVATLQTSADDEPRRPAQTNKWVSPTALNKQYSGGGSRSASASASSRKRSQSQISGPDDEVPEGKSHAYTRNVRAKLWTSGTGHEKGHHDSYEDEDENEEADDWYDKNVAGKQSDIDDKDDDTDDDDWYERNVAGAGPQSDEERGRSRKHRQRRERSEHTVDTLPSLTDTSAVGDLEDLDHNSFLPPSADPVNIHAKDPALDGNMLSVKNAT